MAANMKKNPNLTVYYAANEWGYIVQVVCGVKIINSYRAGNSPKESTAIVSLANAETPEQLQVYARLTALKMAEENGVYKKNVQYDSELHQQIPTLEGP
jgi:hypothetical protein